MARFASGTLIAALVGWPAPAAEDLAEDDAHASEDLAKCAALAEQGRRREAIEACRRTSPRPESAIRARAMVHALMSGDAPPSVEELGQAFLLADEMRRRHPDGPSGYAAICDIALRIGDGVMLCKCVDDLKRVGPGQPETLRAQAALVARRPAPWRFWAGRLLVVGSAVATAAHGLWGSIRRSARRRVAAGVTAALVGPFAIPSAPAYAEPSPDHPDRTSNWTIDDANPEGTVPSVADRNRDPIEFGYWLQDLAAKASSAAKRGDHAAAVKYFRAMVVAVPDRAVGFTRLCDEYEALGDVTRSIASCHAALQVEGVKLNDYVHYVHLLLTKPGALSSQEIGSLSAVLDQLRSDPGAGKDIVDEVSCEVAVRTDDVDLLRRCVEALRATAPAKPTTILYQWTLAMKDDQLEEARRAIEHAQKTSMNPEAVARMQRETDDVVRQRKVQRALWLLAAVLAVTGIGAAMRGVVRRSKQNDLASREATTA